MPMRIACLLIVLFAPGLALADPCPAFVPGQSLGPIKLGMTQTELAATGLPIKSLERSLEVGDFNVTMVDDRVSSVQSDSTRLRCVEIDGEEMLLSRPFEALAMAASISCRARKYGYGIDSLQCNGTAFVEDRNRREVQPVISQIVVHPVPDDVDKGTVCSRYVIAGLVGDSQVSRTVVDANQDVCVGAHRYHHKMAPDDIVTEVGTLTASRCNVVAGIGEMTFTCEKRGLRFVFTGSGGDVTLSSVEAVKVKL